MPKIDDRGVGDGRTTTTTMMRIIVIIIHQYL